MLPRRCFGSALLLVALSALLVAPITATGPSAQANPSGTGVVITTVRMEDGNAPSYVELYNPTPSIVFLGGWSLQLRADRPNGGVFAKLPLVGVIPPNSYFLVEGTLSEGDHSLPIEADQVAIQDFAIIGLPSVLVLADTTETVPANGDLAGAPNVIDALGWGEGDFPFIPPVHLAADGWEGSGPVNPQVFTPHLVRSGCAVDTDDNPTDFTLTDDPDLHHLFMTEPACLPPCQGQVPTVAGEGSIVGTAGPDVIVGSFQDDVIDGKGGNDVICARDGDDVVAAGPGNDVVYGGVGNDDLTAGTGDDELSGGANDDTLSAGATDTVGDDLLGNAGHDILTGGPADDLLLPGPGDDTAIGGGGADVLSSAGGEDLLRGGGGPDVLKAGAEADTVLGGAGDDTAYGGTGEDLLDGADGNDLLWGGDDADVLRGGPDDDTLRGQGGTDLLDGGSGTNHLFQ